MGYSGMGNSGMGYSDMVSRGLVPNPKAAYSRPSNLKITDIRGCVLATHFPNPIIKIYTNEGITGLGEVRDAGWLASALLMKPYLVGKDPLDLHAILRSIRHLGRPRRYGGGYSAVDIALMDIAGKALGVPAWKLLGTGVRLGERRREAVPLYAATGPIQDTPRYRAFMQARVEKGYQHYKFNVSDLGGIEGALRGGLPTRKGLQVWGEEVLKLRDIIGYDVGLGAQAFGQQTVRSGIAIGEFMDQAKYGLSFIEELVDFQRFDSVHLNKAITEGSPTPTQAGENIFGLDGFAPFIEAEAFDFIHPDMLTAGGMIETKRIADYADRYGLRTTMHAAPSPVGLIAMVHCASTIRAFHALEYQWRWLQMPWWDDLVTGIEKPIIRQGGVVPVPEGPGLGIEFNEEVAEKHLMEAKYLPFDPGLFAPTPDFDEPISMLEAKEKGLIGYGWDVGYSWWHLDENLDYGYKPRGT